MGFGLEFAKMTTTLGACPSAWGLGDGQSCDFSYFGLLDILVIMGCL